jgi:hypothetical protein
VLLPFSQAKQELAKMINVLQIIRPIYFVFFVSLSLCGFNFYIQASALDISKAEQTRIADLIFKNECNRKFACLVSWNDGEDFASLGIGHFIWFPKHSNALFQESFPDLLRWYQKQGVGIPANLQSILKPELPAPWQHKADFLKPENQAMIQVLRHFLADTQQVQTTFIMQRLSNALSKMLEVGQSDAEKQKIEQQFKRVASSANGWYALIDYVNFKGESIKPSERYQDKGWGLAQVLLNMQQTNDALADFRRAAAFVLARRIQLSPPARGEQRWLKGWLKRIETYR